MNINTWIKYEYKYMDKIKSFEKETCFCVNTACFIASVLVNAAACSMDVIIESEKE